MLFNEHALELFIIELLQNKGYIHQTENEKLCWRKCLSFTDVCRFKNNNM